jgi:hypothetical protein
MWFIIINVIFDLNFEFKDSWKKKCWYMKCYVMDEWIVGFLKYKIKKNKWEENIRMDLRENVW